MSLHLTFPRDYGVLSLLITQANLDGVKVWIQLLELQLTLRDLVKGDTQQTVLMELTEVMKTWGRITKNSIWLMDIPWCCIH